MDFLIAKVKFWNYCLNLVLSNYLEFYSNRLVVPDSLKKEILDKLHGTHQGTRDMELQDSHCFFGKVCLMT